MIDRSVWIGWDPREAKAFEVARRSLLRHMRESIPVHKLSLDDLIGRGLYKRPFIRSPGRLRDLLSARDDYDGSISTEHALARFFVPLIGKGWALFMDGDMLVRGDITRAFEGLDPGKAVYCVKHDHTPINTLKMDGQLQTRYPRKNWSSFMIWNCDHPLNTRLSVLANHLAGRDLHRFCWLEEKYIGELDRGFNHLVGWSRFHPSPTVVHFTEGTPDMPGYEHCDYADEWRSELASSI